MNSSAPAIISFIALVSYCALFWVFVYRRSDGRIGPYFGLYIISLIAWSLGSFTLYAFPDTADILFWNRFMFLGVVAMPITFFECIQEFLNHNARRWVWPGFFIFAVVQATNALGWVVSGAQLFGNALSTTYNWGIALVDAVWAFFLGYSLLHLVQRYRALEDAGERRRIQFLFLAIALIIAGYLSYATDLRVYPVNVGLNVVTAGVAAFAFFADRFNFKVLVRRGVNYLVPTLLVCAIYFLAIYLVGAISGKFSDNTLLNTAVVGAVVIILVYRPLQEKVQSWINRAFYKEQYESDQMLLRLEQLRSSALPLDELVQRTLNEATSTLRLANACLFLEQGEGGDFCLTAASGVPAAALKLAGQHPLVQYLKGAHASLTRLELDINPHFKSLWKQEIDQLAQLGADLFIPLTVKARLAGILSVGPKLSGAPLTTEELHTLTTVAGRMADTIETARLYQSESRRRNEAEALQSALRQLTSEIDLEEVLDNILTSLAAIIEYDYACIFLANQERIVGAAQHGLPHPETVIGQEYLVEADDLFMEVLQSNQPLMIADLQAYHAYKSFGIPKSVRSWMGVPLISRGKVSGFLSLSSNRPGVYSEEEQANMVVNFASHAALIIENARLFKVEREQRQLAEALREIGVVLSTTLDFDHVLDLILDQVGRVVPYAVANILLVENKAIRVARTRYHAALDADTAQLLKTSSFSISPAPNMYYMADAALPLVISEVPFDASWIESPVPIRSWVGAPVLIKGKVIACFSLAHLEPGYYRNHHAELLEVFAGQAALALQNAQLNADIQKLAIQDELTGAFNRSQFALLGEREFNRAQRYERPLSVIMFDLDHFKRLNEDFGHSIGDQVLRVVAERCRSNIREVDILGRYGGEEFAVVLPEAGPLDVQRISERLRRDIAKMPVSTTAGPISVTISIGAASISKDVINFVKLIANAEFAVYQAKRRGRNNVFIYDESVE